MEELVELLSYLWNHLPRQLPQSVLTFKCLPVIAVILLMVIVMLFIAGEHKADDDKKINWVWLAFKEVIGFIIFLPYWSKNRRAMSWTTLESDQVGLMSNGNTSDSQAVAVIPARELIPYLADRPDYMGIKLRYFEQKLNASYQQLISGELFWKVRIVIVGYRNHKKIKRMYKGLEEIEMRLNLESCAQIAQEILKQRQALFNQDKMEVSFVTGMDKLKATFERLANVVEGMSEDKLEKDEYVRFFAKELVFPRIKDEIVRQLQTLSPEEEHKLRQAIVQQAQAAQEAQDEMFD